MWQTVERVDALDDITGGAREGCKALERAMGELRSALIVQRQPASVAARAFAESVGIKRDIEATSPSPSAAARRWGNVEALLRTFGKREQREIAKGNDATHERALAAFLHALTLTFADNLVFCLGDPSSPEASVFAFSYDLTGRRGKPCPGKISSTAYLKMLSSWNSGVICACGPHHF